MEVIVVGNYNLLELLLFYIQTFHLNNPGCQPTFAAKSYLRIQIICVEDVFYFHRFHPSPEVIEI